MRGETIAARAYSFETSELETLKKLLEYDPYLDSALIPKVPKDYDDPAYLKKHPEEIEKATELRKQADEAMQKLKSDADANIIFARQDYLIKEGTQFGLEASRQCLYLSAPDDFMYKAEKKLMRVVPSVKRLEPEMERKAIEAIDAERKQAKQGLGFIFG